MFVPVELMERGDIGSRSELGRIGKAGVKEPFVVETESVVFKFLLPASGEDVWTEFLLLSSEKFAALAYLH